MTVWINRRTGVMHRNRSCLALEHVLPGCCARNGSTRTDLDVAARARGALRRDACVARLPPWRCVAASSADVNMRDETIRLYGMGGKVRSNRCRLSTYRFCDGRSTAARSAPESMPTSSRWRGSRPDEVSTMTGVRCQLPRGAPWRARGASGAHGPLEDRDYADLSSPARTATEQWSVSETFPGALPVGAFRAKATSGFDRCTRLCRPLPNHSATSPGTRMVAPWGAAPGASRLSLAQSSSVLRR